MELGQERGTEGQKEAKKEESWFNLQPSNYPYNYLCIKFKLLRSTTVQFCWFVCELQLVLLRIKTINKYWFSLSFISIILFKIPVCNCEEITVWEFEEIKGLQFQRLNMFILSFPTFCLNNSISIFSPMSSLLENSSWLKAQTF